MNAPNLTATATTFSRVFSFDLFTMCQVIRCQQFLFTVTESETRRVFLKWSWKTRQSAKMYPPLAIGYANDDKTELFRQV